MTRIEELIEKVQKVDDAARAQLLAPLKNARPGQDMMTAMFEEGARSQAPLAEALREAVRGLEAMAESQSEGGAEGFFGTASAMLLLSVREILTAAGGGK